MGFLRKGIPQNYNLKTSAWLGVKLGKILDFIVNRREFIKFCIKSTFVVTIPSIALVLAAYFIINYFFGNAESFLPKHTETNFVIDFIFMVVFSPFVETYILIKLLHLLKSFENRKTRLCIIAGVIFGIMHSLVGLLWFFGPCWAFMVFSFSYLTWEEKNIKLAFWAACIPHMLNNCFALILETFTK